MSTELTVSETPDTVGLGLGVRADFDVDLVKCDVEGNPISTRRVLDRCPNLITNYGLDVLNGTTSGSSWIMVFSNSLHVGMSSDVPSYSDLALGNKRTAVNNGGSGNNGYAWDTANGNPRTFVLTRVFQFGVGAASGAITELGLSPTTTGQITTHALFKDAFGDPTTINVAADESLVVTYRIYVVPNETVSTLIKTVNGTEYTLQMSWARLGAEYGNSVYFGYPSVPLAVYTNGPSNYHLIVEAYYGATSGLGPVTDNPVGTASSQHTPTTCSLTFTPYVSGNYYNQAAVTIGLNAANFSNIGAFRFTGTMFFQQISISPRINKTSNDTIKFTARFSCSRI